MPGRGLEIVAHTRPVFDGGTVTLTFSVPLEARKGDLLIAVVVRSSSEVGTPAGWTEIQHGLGGANHRLGMYARLVEDNEPAAVAFSAGDAPELQGQLLLIRASSPTLVYEASATASFTATATPATPAVNSVHATNLLLTIFSAVGAVALTAQAGFTAIDSYSSAILVSRSILLSYKPIIGTTGSISSPAAAAAPAATGRAFSVVLRERPPVLPVELLDPVPGNIGLLPL